MAVGRNDVPTLLEAGLLGCRQAMRLALQPCLTRGDDATTIDKEFEYVIVRKLYPQVFLQVIRGQIYATSDVDVAVLRAPVVATVGVLVGCAPGSIFRSPRTVVEVGSSPTRAILAAIADLSRPAAFAC